MSSERNWAAWEKNWANVLWNKTIREKGAKAVTPEEMLAIVRAVREFMADTLAGKIDINKAGRSIQTARTWVAEKLGVEETHEGWLVQDRELEWLVWDFVDNAVDWVMKDKIEDDREG